MSGKNILGKNFTKGKAIILCFILVSLAASVTMSPILSASPGYRVRLPNFSVNMVETYPGAQSYFGTTLSGIIGAGYDVSDGLFVGWCCDEEHYIYPGTTYSVRLYSTYDPLMPWSDPDWDMVNYLLNHKDPAANKGQIQSAIWKFIDGGYTGSDSIILGMITDAIAYGEGFVPQEGEICAVLCDAGPTIQHTFIEVLVPPPPCTVYVDDDYTVSTPGYGYDHFKIIQDGVDAVCDSGIVIVHDGIYNEHVIINKPIILQAGSSPIIDGGGSGNGITIAADGVTIDGFEIRNCANGIFSYGTDNSIIKNNIIHDNLNTGYAGCGIMFWSDVNDFDDNQILDNEIYNNDRQGIFIGQSYPYHDTIISDGNTISGNTIYTNGLNTLANPPDNSAYGIQLSYADSNIISDNDIYGHIWDYTGSGYWFGQGIYLNNAYENTVTNNNGGLHDNNYGVAQYTDGGRTIGKNYVNCNDIYGNTEYGIKNFDSVEMDAECNWWGDCSGPSGEGPGSGDAVSTNVDFNPWIGLVVADAGGPYNTIDEDGFVQFDGSNSIAYSCCGGTVTYEWDFGDGYTGTGKKPKHYYGETTETFIATLTVTTDIMGHVCADTDTVIVNVANDDPPIVQLEYPRGGEELSGTVTVKWFAVDSEDWGSPDIWLYYSADGGVSWVEIARKLQNNIGGGIPDRGEYRWSTSSLSDGNYILQIDAYDAARNKASDRSKPFLIDNHGGSLNHPPDKPTKPSGPTSGKAGEEFTYRSSTSDPDGDQVWYMWDCGDGKNSGWLGPYNSGVTINTTRNWTVKGSYSIKVKAKDTLGAESPWSDSLPITMPYTYKPPLIQFLDWLFQRFPNAFPILRQLLGY
jgi:hypothetical protein